MFSAGLILFVMVSGGILPFLEEDDEDEEEVEEDSTNETDKKSKKIDLFSLLKTNPTKFWERHTRMGTFKGGVERVSKEFKTLFEGLVSADPETRLTIEQVKATEWFNNENVLSDEELNEQMSRKLNELEQEQEE
mmetsp:Transcript_137771/g.194897  ORF Transcript_137771/g.194897 Transcript_137771/m.194897 type:complete len:135 (-) Transcript_137771:196-600(-)